MWIITVAIQLLTESFQCTLPKITSRFPIRIFKRLFTLITYTSGLHVPAKIVTLIKVLIISMLLLVSGDTSPE